ncbi:GNAT family N-acetyltransferase [Halobacillus litoralis]|uniref:GNAT family N-acetyltransferase n=1 Tax=Halobacillus litoralis TaxID=45668 RepID=UPI001CFDC33E|nr:GNAT family N-acetyltransferase [Halobacillus litoralis]
MSVILENATDDELIRANQRNLMDYFKLTSEHSEDIHYYKEEGVEGLYCPELPAGVVNRIIKTEERKDNLAQMIKRGCRFYQGKKSALFWEVWPSISPSNMEDILKGEGFRYSSDYPAMAIPLDQVQQEDLNNLKIKEVESKVEARLFADLFQEIYQLPDIAGNSFYELVIHAGFNEDLVSYIGYEYGKPVCISVVYYSAGVAGIYNVGTRSDHCRKGYGRLITAYPLMDAKKRGYQYAVLQSSDQGEKVYQRMGFREQCRVLRLEGGGKA